MGNPTSASGQVEFDLEAPRFAATLDNRTVSADLAAALQLKNRA